MKVYVKYIDKLDSNYKVVPLEENKKNLLYTKEEIVNLLEANKFEVSKSKTIRFYNKEYYGWQIFTDDQEVMPKKIMIELNRSYKKEKFIPKIEQMLIKIETVMAQMRILILKSIINQNTNVKKGIVILTSSPLKYDQGEESQSIKSNYYNPINFEGCISNIIDTTKSYNLEYKYSILTKESLKSISSSSFCPFIPVVIHIYCHSGYDSNGNFYLSFEDKHGNLIKGTTEDFKQLNTSLIHKYSKTTDEPLYIIVTPHNEDAADLLSQAGINNYLCIHSNLINDYQERKFTKLFYESLLLKENVTNATESASLFMETEYKSNPLFQCCCFHSHQSNCKWKLKAIEDHYRGHIDHMAYMCKCKDKQYNMHKKVGCHWAKYFIDKYSPMQIKNPKSKKVCCCSIHLPHDKVIQLKYSYNNKIMIPFKDVVKSDRRGSRITHSCLNLPFSLSLITSLNGRNSIVYDIVNYFIENNGNDNREDKLVVILTGQKNVGKKELAKYCGIYLYEREYINDVIIINNEKCTSEKSIIDSICKTESTETTTTTTIIDNQLNILLIILIDSNQSKLKEYLPLIISKYSNIKYLIVNESNAELNIGKIITVEPLLLPNISNLINELDPTINNLDTRTNIVVQDTRLSDYDNLLLETEGKLYKIFLLNKTFNDKKGLITINELQKVIRENTDTIDVSFIKSDPLKLELLYLLQFSENGFSFNDLDFFLYPAPIELLFEMFPIVIKRTRDEEDFFQIQSSFLPMIIKTIKIPQTIKVKVKQLLIVKFAMMYRYFINKKCAHITDFGAQLNYGMWNSLLNTPPSEINQTCLARLNDKKRLMFCINLFFVKETLQLLFEHKDIDQNELKAHLEDLSITIPTLFYFKENIHSLNLIKYFSRLFDNFDNFEFAKGRLYLLFAFFHSNVGISTYENFILEEEQIKKAIWYFKIICFDEGLGECYFFSSVNKFNCRSLICPENDYVEDIKTAIKYYSQCESNGIGYARAAYQAAYYDFINQMVLKNNYDNLIKALDVFGREASNGNSNALYWQLQTLLLISQILMSIEEYIKAKNYLDKGKGLLSKCNEEDIKVEYKKYEEKLALSSSNERNKNTPFILIEDEGEDNKDNTKPIKVDVKCIYSSQNIFLNALDANSIKNNVNIVTYNQISEEVFNKLLKDQHCDMIMLSIRKKTNSINSILDSFSKDNSNKLKCKLLFLISHSTMQLNSIIKQFLQIGVYKIILILMPKEVNKVDYKTSFSIRPQSIQSEFFYSFIKQLSNDMSINKAFEISIEKLISMYDMTACSIRFVYYSNDNILSPSKVRIIPDQLKENCNDNILQLSIHQLPKDQSAVITPLISSLQFINKFNAIMDKDNRTDLLKSINEKISNHSNVLISIEANEISKEGLSDVICKYIMTTIKDIDIVIRVDCDKCKVLIDFMNIYKKHMIDLINDTKNNTLCLKCIILIDKIPIEILSDQFFDYLSNQKGKQTGQILVLSHIVILNHNVSNNNLPCSNQKSNDCNNEYLRLKNQLSKLYTEYIGELS